MLYAFPLRLLIGTKNRWLDSRITWQTSGSFSPGFGLSVQKIAAGTILWGAGVLASPEGRWLGAENDKLQRA